MHDLREIVNEILYVNRTRIPWEYLPHDFLPYKTVYDYRPRWRESTPMKRSNDASATCSPTLLAWYRL